MNNKDKVFVGDVPVKPVAPPKRLTTSVDVISDDINSLKQILEQLVVDKHFWKKYAYQLEDNLIDKEKEIKELEEELEDSKKRLQEAITKTKND